MPHFLAHCALSEDAYFGSSPTEFQDCSAIELSVATGTQFLKDVFQ